MSSSRSSSSSSRWTTSSLTWLLALCLGSMAQRIKRMQWEQFDTTFLNPSPPPVHDDGHTSPAAKKLIGDICLASPKDFFGLQQSPRSLNFHQSNEHSSGSRWCGIGHGGVLTSEVAPCPISPSDGATWGIFYAKWDIDVAKWDIKSTNGLPVGNFTSF